MIKARNVPAQLFFNKMCNGHYDSKQNLIFTPIIINKQRYERTTTKIHRLLITSCSNICSVMIPYVKMWHSELSPVAVGWVAVDYQIVDFRVQESVNVNTYIYFLRTRSSQCVRILFRSRRAHWENCRRVGRKHKFSYKKGFYFSK